jgi:hypothetical protein
VREVLLLLQVRSRSQASTYFDLEADTSQDLSSSTSAEVERRVPVDARMPREMRT